MKEIKEENEQEDADEEEEKDEAETGAENGISIVMSEEDKKKTQGSRVSYEKSAP